MNQNISMPKFKITAAVSPESFTDKGTFNLEILLWNYYLLVINSYIVQILIKYSYNAINIKIREKNPLNILLSQHARTGMYNLKYSQFI